MLGPCSAVILAGRGRLEGFSRACPQSAGEGRCSLRWTCRNISHLWRGPTGGCRGPSETLVEFDLVFLGCQLPDRMTYLMVLLSTDGYVPR